MAMMTESHIERAKAEFFDWWAIEGNRLGEGDYEDAARKINKVTKDFLKEDMTLHLKEFRFGFSFYYGEISGFEQSYQYISLGF